MRIHNDDNLNTIFIRFFYAHVNIIVNKLIVMFDNLYYVIEKHVMINLLMQEHKMKKEVVVYRIIY